MTTYTHRNGETTYPSVPGTYWTEHPISGEFRTRSISQGDIDFDNMLPLRKRAGNYYAFYGPIPLPSAPPMPAPIPDNPDGDDPLGIHAQRWVRVDWNTAVSLQAVLRGDDSPPLRLIVEMLHRRIEDALKTPQEPDAPAMPRADWLTQFPPEWDKHPWANWACLHLLSSHESGARLEWLYFEHEPVWGELSYNRTHGLWGQEAPVKSLPLRAIFDTRLTLQRRPQEGE